MRLQNYLSTCTSRVGKIVSSLHRVSMGLREALSLFSARTYSSLLYLCNVRIPILDTVIWFRLDARSHQWLIKIRRMVIVTYNLIDFSRLVWNFFHLLHVLKFQWAALHTTDFLYLRGASAWKFNINLVSVGLQCQVYYSLQAAQMISSVDIVRIWLILSKIWLTILTNFT